MFKNPFIDVTPPMTPADTNEMCTKRQTLKARGRCKTELTCPEAYACNSDARGCHGAHAISNSEGRHSLDTEV